MEMVGLFLLIFGVAIFVLSGIHSGKLSKSEFFIRSTIALLGLILYGYGLHFLKAFSSI